jgi:Family of unknown function (DUF6220)
VTRTFRAVYLVLAWAFLAGITAQVFLIGLDLFADPGMLAVHEQFGWVLHLSPLLVLLFAVLSRAGRGSWLLSLALAVTVFIVPILAALKTTSPTIAALHPVGATIAFALSVAVAGNAWHVYRMPWATTPGPVAGA